MANTQLNKDVFDDELEQMTSAKTNPFYAKLEALIEEEKEACTNSEERQEWEEEEAEADVEAEQAKVDPQPIPTIEEEEVVRGNDFDREVEPAVFGLKRMDMIEEKDNTFLIDNLIPNGELTVLAGSGGESKSYVSLAIAAAVSRGYGFPYTKDDQTKVEPKNVLIYTKEDSLEKILAARLRILEARKDNIWATEEIIDMSSEKGLQRLEEDIKAKNPALVIIDPATAYCGSLDLERRPLALKFLYPLAAIAKRVNIPIILIFHFNKDYTAESVVTRIAGSAAIVDAARSALIVIKNPDNLDQKLIVHVKGNYSEKGKSLVYEVKKDEIEQEGKKGPGKFDWKDYSEITAGDLSPNRDKELEDFITNTLSDGEMLSTQLNEQIKEAIEGVNGTQIHKAKVRLGITFKTGGAFRKRETGKLWWNRLPKHLQKLK